MAWTCPVCDRIHFTTPKGTPGAARPLGDIGRIAGCGHFASRNGIAPIDASSGDQNRHRLSRACNRGINRRRASWPSINYGTTP